MSAIQNLTDPDLNEMFKISSLFQEAEYISVLSTPFTYPDSLTMDDSKKAMLAVCIGSDAKSVNQKL